MITETAEIKEETKPFRVLTLDGGGMRGLYTAILLQRMVQLFDSKYQVKKSDGSVAIPDIGKAFDLICGTSTGAILACALAVGVPIDEVIKLYIEEGKNIFPSPQPSSWLKYLWALKYRKKAAANADKLKELLDHFFKNETIKNMYDKRNISICIPTINASNHRAWVFKTPHFPDKHRDINYKLSDVCLASSAAPIFFPIANVANPDNGSEQYFVDGGLWANNPIMVGLIEAVAFTKKEQPVELISIGTCEMPTGDPNLLKSNLGVMDWKVGIGITEMSISAQAFGYSNMAKFSATLITSLGKSVTVIRLEESQKSKGQLSSIGLDKSDSTAIKTLKDLASSDTDLNHSKVINDLQKKDPQKESQIIKNIFSNMDELKK